MARPNILWICTDQQRYDTIAALGYPGVVTPTVDGLVGDGVACTRAYCNSPICTPSRASFLTGTYPSTVHNARNGNRSWGGRFPLVTRLLADAGYDCGLIGKLHLSSAYGRIEERTDDGYRFWRYSHAPRDDWETGHDYADWVASRGANLGELLTDGNGVPAELHQTTWCAEETIAFIREQRQGPWLASVNIYDPHPPFNPPTEYRSRFDPADAPPPLFRDSDLAQQRRLQAVDFQSEGRRPDDLDIRNPVMPASPGLGLTEKDLSTSAGNETPWVIARDAATLRAAYFAMISLIDDSVARMLEAVDDAGATNDTLVIFTSDHGETLGDHGLIQKGCRFYEGLIRVPLVFRWPGRFASGVRCTGLTDLLDLAPTLLEAAELDVPPWMQGRSLTPILTGSAPADRHKEVIRCEYYDALDQPDASHATMHLRDPYKLVVYHGHGLGELYDLDRDPDEFNDLWDDPDYGDLKAELIAESFDASMLAMDPGTERIGPM